MATYSSSRTTKTRHSWFVPAEYPLGAPIAEFQKALSACHQSAKEFGIDTSFDTWCWVTPSDDQVEIWFEIEEKVIQ